jgi:hypothetical protein
VQDLEMSGEGYADPRRRLPVNVAGSSPRVETRPSTAHVLTAIALTLFCWR